MPPAVLDLNPESARALQIMEESDRSLLLTGRAGTGKSTLLRHFRDRARKRVAVLAPTGVAALNVRGATIHSFFRFGTHVTPEAVATMRVRDRTMYARLQTLVLDEVSMVRADLFECVDAFLRLHGPIRSRPFGGVQMVLIGDLYQLPPIVTPDDDGAFGPGRNYPSAFFFDAPAFAALAPETVELTRVYRQHEETFIEVLNAIRDGTVAETQIAALNARVDAAFDPAPDELVVCLTPTNRAADAINARRLAALPGGERTYRASVGGDLKEGAFPAPAELAVKPGAQVMMVNNDPEGRWVNGSLGRVRAIESTDEGDLVRIRLVDGDTVAIAPHQWDLFRYVWNRADRRLDTESIGSFTQYPFRLAWAVTIHKAQGKTFDRVVVDLGTGAFAAGQVYVALSRCTTLGGLVLRRPLRRAEVFSDRRVARFLRDREAAAAAPSLPEDAKVTLIRAAIREKRSLLLTYLKPNDERSLRTVTPTRLGDAELAAFCHLRHDRRTFRLDRIVAVDPAPDPGRIVSAARRPRGSARRPPGSPGA